jgi:hypothetical protein
MPQGLWSPVASALQPLAARSFADAHGLGDLALGPAFFLEEPGLQPAGFFPVVERRVQAWPSIADHPETLVFNVPLSNLLCNSQPCCATQPYCAKPPPGEGGVREVGPLNALGSAHTLSRFGPLHLGLLRPDGGGEKAWS